MDSLQFETAEFSDNTPKCAACQQNLGSTYFQLAGNNICPGCAELVRQGSSRPSHAAVAKGLLYGTGAAFLCFLGYSLFIWFTNIQFALISIFIGFAIGKAVRTGSSGLGGRRCQIAAVALTYFAITASSVPAGLRDFSKQQAQQQKSQVVTPQRPPTVAGILLGLVIIGGLALASPFLELADGVGGILSIIIIGVGLQRAWQMTARDERALVGPFEREATVPVG